MTSTHLLPSIPGPGISRAFRFTRCIRSLWILALCVVSAGSALAQNAASEIHSFVLLMAEPTDLDEAEVGTLLTEALGQPMRAGKDPANGVYFVDGSTTYFQFEDRMYMLNQFDRPYVDDPEAIAEKLGGAIAPGMAAHRAWLSVDLDRGGLWPAADQNAGYEVLSKVISAVLADHDALVAYDYHSRQMRPVNLAFRTRMAEGPDFRATVFAEPGAVQIPPDHPRILAAIEEAQTTLPTFVEAFQSEDGSEFVVKASFTDPTPGDEEAVSESMWVRVTGAEDDRIQGILLNAPYFLTHVRQGEAVNLESSAIQDWKYDNAAGEQMGAFTVRAIDAIEAEAAGRGASTQP